MFLEGIPRIVFRKSFDSDGPRLQPFRGLPVLTVQRLLKEFV